MNTFVLKNVKADIYSKKGKWIILNTKIAYGIEGLEGLEE